MTFHLFKDLPAELRYLVWEMAARDFKRPGVQFLYTNNRDDKFRYVYPDDADQYLQPNAMVYVDGDSDEEDEIDKWLIRNDPRSSYTIGQGLWNACREARQVLLLLAGEEWAEVRPGNKWFAGPGIEAFDRQKWNNQVRSRQDELMQMPAVILPYEDLIIPITRSNDTQAICLWAAFSYYDRVIRVHHVQHFGLPICHFQSERNIDSFRDEDELDFLTSRRHSGPKIWLIDMSIKREGKFDEHINDSKCTLDSTRKVFQGNGCRYIEVRPEDSDWVEAEPMRCAQTAYRWIPTAPATSLDSRGFVERLNKLREENHEGCYVCESSENDEKQFGLLACEESDELKAVRMRWIADSEAKLAAASAKYDAQIERVAQAQKEVQRRKGEVQRRKREVKKCVARLGRLKGVDMEIED